MARRSRQTRAQIREETDRLHMVAERMRREGAEVREIASAVKRRVGTVRAWLRDDCIPPPSTELRGMRAAHRIKDQAAALYARGISIDAIAGKLDVDRHVARAAVYLAMKEGGAS